MYLKDITRILPAQAGALKRLKIETANDLLYHFPLHYGDVAESISIEGLTAGMKATIFGRISKLKTKKAFKSKIPMATATVTDDTGSIDLIWFNQAYLAKMFTEGSLVRVEGTVSERKGLFSISNPHIESISKVPTGVGDSLFNENENHSLYPVYAESKGITSNWMYHTLQKIFNTAYFENIIDPIPKDILDKYHLPSLKTAFIWIHTPQKKEHAESARKRFAFEEIFYIQLKKQQEKKKVFESNPYIIDVEKETIDKFISRFPFKFTDGQMKAIQDILNDFSSGHPGSRLLEGDVGSGKTAVAATTAFATTVTRPRGQTFGHLQTAYMCPTEILAKQHFESFIKFFEHLPINIGLLTSSGCKKFPSKVASSWKTGNGSTDISRSQLLKWVANGEIPILVGTHSLISKSVQFKHLAYVIIDEQHRFGVNQRQKLARKDNRIPHLLSMTATPIPRTLALTLYGDLDLTVVEGMPHGRKPVITEIIMPGEREKSYELMRKEIQNGRQAYVICPRIDAPDPSKEMAINAKSAKEEAKRLKKDVFPEYEIAVMHSKMKPNEKEKVMKDFENGKIHILVSTSVIEVGVNVPNATVMIIEGAERFGLAQLHQLRGRVIRSNHQAYCFICTEKDNEKTTERLLALKTAKNSFELAERDLAIRGAGGLSEGKQWGLSDIGMEAIKNIKMVESARNEAKRLVEENIEFDQYPLLKKEIDSREDIHFE